MTTTTWKPTLPHRPHIDHLRKEAKARLTQMRASQPNARLAEAQHALARDYGFTNWGTLRDEVFRRATAEPRREIRVARRRSSRAAVYRDSEHRDAILDPAAHIEAQLPLFEYGAATNAVILFVYVAILTSMWTFLLGAGG